MAIQTTSFTASGTFSLTDAEGTTVFSYSPSFTSSSNVASISITAGEVLAGTTAVDILIGGEDAAAVAASNHDRIYTFVKNIDSDHSIEVSPAGQEDASSMECADLKPGEFFFAPMELNSDANTTTSLTVGNGTSAQKVQYLLCDAIDN